MVYLKRFLVIIFTILFFCVMCITLPVTVIFGYLFDVIRYIKTGDSKIENILDNVFDCHTYCLLKISDFAD